MIDKVFPSGFRIPAAVLLVISVLTPAVAAPADGPRLELHTRDAVFLGSGLLLAGAGLALDTRTEAIPGTGLDREDISLGWDRRSIRVPRPGPDNASTVLGIGTALTPYLLNLAGASDNRFHSQLRLGRVQGESLVLTAGTFLVLKSAFSRARPFAYFSQEKRPSDYDEEDAFHSFPSGHAALSWSAGTAGMVYLASEHPEMPHFLSGALLGGLATATSLLRVEAGEHFPTDVAAGAVLGSGIGLGVTLFHLNAEGRAPAGSSLRDGFLGMAAGAVVAFLLTPPTSPWVE